MAALGTAKDVVSVVKTSLQILQSCMSAAERLVSNHIRIGIEDALMKSRFDILLADIRNALATVGRLDRVTGPHPVPGTSAQDDAAIQHAVTTARARIESVIARAREYMPGEEHAAEVIAEAQQFLEGHPHSTAGSNRSSGVAARIGRVVKKVHRAWKPEVYEGHWNDIQEAVRQVDDACQRLLAVGARVQRVPQQPQYVPPPVFGDVVDALLDPSVRVVVLHGPPALGKSALVKQVWSLACSPGDLAEEIQESAYYLCREGYLCDVEGKPSKLAELHAHVTGVVREEGPQADESVAAKLVTHLGHAFVCRLLILDGLVDGSECFSEGSTLAELPGRLSVSKLLITSCSEHLCHVLQHLPQCRSFKLQRTDNENHVMHKLMQQLVSGDKPRAQGPPEWQQLPEAPGKSKLLAAVRSCIKQCQGCPHLLHLVNGAVRRPIAENKFTVNTLEPQYEQYWTDCKSDLLLAADAAGCVGMNAADYKRRLFSIYHRLVLKVMALPTPGPLAEHTNRAVRATLRVIAYEEQDMPSVASKAWYWWADFQTHVLMRELADDPDLTEDAPARSPGDTPGAAGGGAHACGTARSSGALTDDTVMSDGVEGSETSSSSYSANPVLLADPTVESAFNRGQPQRRVSARGVKVMNFAMLRMVELGMLEMQPHARPPAGRADPRMVRFHELLRLCLCPRDHQQDAEIKKLIGPPPSQRTTLQDIWAAILNVIIPVHLNWQTWRSGP